MAVEIAIPASDLELPDPEVLTGLVRKYKEGPLTPELVNRFWKTFLEISIKTRGLNIPVPAIECDRTQKEPEALRKKGRMWIPETKLTYPELGRIFPETDNSALWENSRIEDAFIQDANGVDVEVSIDPPNKKAKGETLEKRFAKKERRGMRLSTYILASQASKALTGQYLDEGSADSGTTWSWLPGSSFDGYVLAARFDAKGRLYILWNLPPQYYKSYLGGRSEGRKRA